MSAREIRPQPGPQEAFLGCSADIAIYGGAAFGGKTYALLLEASRHTGKGAYGGVILRRTRPQITNEGGLWDTSQDIYPGMGATPSVQRLQWRFPSGAKLTFSPLQHETDKLGFQGSQIPFIGFDELTHFTEGQFWYLASRNRDPSGTIRPYIRGTCNPDPDSFVADLIGWYIDPDTGYAIPERSGVIRYLARVHGAVVWGDSPEELQAAHPGCLPLSFTFIASSYKDNVLGLKADPGYLARLDNLPRVEAERLKNGNWLVRPASGDYFRESDFRYCWPAELPARRIRVRWWDRAATVPSEANPDPDWSVGVLMSADPSDGTVYIEDVDRFRLRPGGVQQRMLAAAERDGRATTVGLYRDPAAAGIAEADYLLRLLAGYRTAVAGESARKETKIAPLSSYAQGAGPGQGKVVLVRGAWNAAFIAEAENFPKSAHDDQLDACAGAFNWLAPRIRAAVAYDYRIPTPLAAGRRTGAVRAVGRTAAGGAVTLRWRAHQSPYVIRSEPPGWSVCITLTGPRIPLPGPPRQERGQSCPWLRVPGPPTARFAAWRLPAPDARTPEGRMPMAEALGTFRTAAAARACCQADATSRAARRDLTESIEADEHG